MISRITALRVTVLTMILPRSSEPFFELSVTQFSRLSFTSAAITDGGRCGQGCDSTTSVLFLLISFLSSDILSPIFQDPACPRLLPPWVSYFLVYLTLPCTHFRSTVPTKSPRPSSATTRPSSSVTHGSLLRSWLPPTSAVLVSLVSLEKILHSDSLFNISNRC